MFYASASGLRARMATDTAIPGDGATTRGDGPLSTCSRGARRTLSGTRRDNNLMPQLLKLRFVSLGHPQARMDDLLLSFQGPDGRAIDSTLWLRNGGGKSSILNLFFAIVRPHKGEFLG